jgi:hypothetical protein
MMRKCEFDKVGHCYLLKRNISGYMRKANGAVSEVRIGVLAVGVKDGMITIAGSLCSDLDNFSIKTGIFKAYGRLYSRNNKERKVERRVPIFVDKCAPQSEALINELINKIFSEILFEQIIDDLFYHADDRRCKNKTVPAIREGASVQRLRGLLRTLLKEDKKNVS